MTSLVSGGGTWAGDWAEDWGAGVSTDWVEPVFSGLVNFLEKVGYVCILGLFGICTPFKSEEFAAKLLYCGFPCLCRLAGNGFFKSGIPALFNLNLNLNFD